MDTGKMKLAVGRARFTSEVTQECDLLTFSVLHFGDHNINAGVRRFRNEKSYQQTLLGMKDAFSARTCPK